MVLVSSSTRSQRGPFLTALALFLSLSLSGSALAQSGEATELGPIAQAAAQRGVRTCLPAIERITANLSANRQVGAFLFNQIDNADENLFSVSLEGNPSPSGGPLYVSLTFAPAGDKCQATIESTMAWQKSCPDAALTFREYQIAGKLLSAIQMLAAPGTGRLFLMPTADGCVTIEKAVLF